MKKVILLLLTIMPQILFSQKVIKLTVIQPAEFAFSISKQDTTIVKGSSVALGQELIVSGGSGEYHFRWTPAATLNDSTAINPVANPTDTTTYLLTVMDKYGCSFSVTYKVNVRDQMVGNKLTENVKSLNAVLFPNPNRGEFKVKLNGIPSEKIELTILDMQGKIIKKQIIRNFTGFQIETIQVHLVSGMYSLLVDSGKESLSRQFIIH